MSAEPRHTEIPPATVRAIARRTGVRLREELAMAIFFPAVVLEPEGYGAEVLGTGVNGSGATVATRS